MRHKLGVALIFVGSLLLLAALALLAYNKWEDWNAGQTVASIADRLNTQMEENSSKTIFQREAEAAEEAATDTEMATIELDGYAYIGTLTIPSFGLELPIMAEWSYPGLKIAPGRYTGSVLTHDLILCGHNYERHFGNLKYLDPGDSLYFTDVNGTTYTYTVALVETLEKTAVEEMTAGEWDLTLFTCTIGGRQRVTVRCTLVE